MKKLVSLMLALMLVLGLCSFAGAETVEEVIAQAETMTLEELFQKAIEESKSFKDLLKDMCKGMNKGRYSFGMEIKRRFLYENGFDAATKFHDKLKKNNELSTVETAIRNAMDGNGLNQSFMLSEGKFIDENNIIKRNSTGSHFDL